MNNNNYGTFALIVFRNSINSTGNPLFMKTEISFDGPAFGLQISVGPRKRCDVLKVP